MAMSPVSRKQVDIREEVDVVQVDPLFIERQRNRYAGRAVAYIVWLNGLAAIALLVGLAHGGSSAESAPRFADAMMVFGIGAAAGLASALFGYLRRTASLELPGSVIERRIFAWLGVAAAIIGAGCFVGAFNMSRMAVTPEATNARSDAPAMSEPASRETPSAPSPPETSPPQTPRQ